MVGRTVIKTKIKSVMIVTKARDHGLVQLTRDLAKWLMTSPRHGKPYGVKVYVDAKLEKSSRFDADGLCKDDEIIREKGLLKFWTPETCVFADNFDIVITVPLFSVCAKYSSVVTAQCCIHLGYSSG
jgi:NAD+ kinase